MTSRGGPQPSEGRAGGASESLGKSAVTVNCADGQGIGFISPFSGPVPQTKVTGQLQMLRTRSKGHASGVFFFLIELTYLNNIV